jgi:uncharacterized protein with PQ loop repeat
MATLPPGAFATVDASYDAVICVVGILFVVGTFVVFLPQIVDIAKYRHTIGISFFSLWIMNMNGFSGGWNIIMLNAQPLRDCGKDGMDCINAISIILQINLAWWMPLIIYILYLIFFTDAKHVHIKKATTILKERPSEKLRWSSKEWHMILFLTVVYILFFIVLVVIYIPLAVVYGISGTETLIYADVVGYITAGLNVVQWFPQIVVTIRKKGSGSFSIATLLLTIPGTFAQAGFLIIANQNPSAWITLIVAGVQQIILLLLLVYFDYVHYRIFKKPIVLELSPEGDVDAIENGYTMYDYNSGDDEFAVSPRVHNRKTKFPSGALVELE